MLEGWFFMKKTVVLNIMLGTFIVILIVVTFAITKALYDSHSSDERSEILFHTYVDSDILRSSGDYKEAIDRYRIIEGIDSEYIPTLYRDMSYSYFGLNDSKNGLLYAGKFLDKAIKSKDKKLLLDAYSLLGAIYCEGDQDRANEFFKKAELLEFNKSLDDGYRANKMANFYANIGKRELAEEYFEKAIKIHNKDLYMLCKDKYEYGAFINSESILIDSLKDSRESENKKTEALALIKIIGDNFDNKKIEETKREMFRLGDLADELKDEDINRMYKNYLIMTGIKK